MANEQEKRKRGYREGMMLACGGWRLSSLEILPSLSSDEVRWQNSYCEQ